MEYKDYYALLGVQRGAPAEEIKRAYRLLARKHHPDLHPEHKKAAASARFKEINEAYQVLSDPETREKYDRLGPGWESGREPRPGPARPETSGFSDFFDELFGGAGETRREKRVTVNLPKYVRDGTKLRLRGQGSAGSGGKPPGDLFLRVKFTPHPAFKVSGSDLETSVTVMPWIAALGGEAVVASLEGPIRIRIPAGTHAGRPFRVSGRGLSKEGGVRGDLYAVARIDIPERMNGRMERLYREMREAGA